MKRRISLNFSIFLFINLLTQVSCSQVNSLSASVVAVNTEKAIGPRLAQLIRQSGIPEADLGLWVSVQGGASEENLLDLNSRRMMVPASLSKLLTLGASLHLLGPSFKFQTSLVSNAPVFQKHLQGDLYLVGGGDPAFVSENLWALINQFSRSNIKVIDGDVVVDESRFDESRIDENRDPKRSDEPYDAPVGAMSFNWNSVNVFIRPQALASQSCEVFAEPDTPYLRVENSCQTGSGEASDVKVKRSQGSAGDVIEVTGRLGANHTEVAFFRNITEPARWSGMNLIEFLKQRGIVVNGKVRSGVLPFSVLGSASAKTYATQNSRPLSLIAQDMAKVSNNFVAEMITKNIAAESGEQPATLATGLSLIRHFLGEMGLDLSQIVFVSPSGFSRKNQISAYQLSKYLKAIQNDFSIFPEFLTSLPVAGRDGTLKDRNKDSKHIGWIRAKTGTLDGVVGLSGYIGMSHARAATFCFIFNGPIEQEADARKLFDALSDEVASQ